MNPQPSQPREVYAEHAYALAERWAERNRDDGDPEYRTVATVILDLLQQRADLRDKLAAAERLANGLGSDMLDTLHAWATLEEHGDDEYEPLHYLARGWRRDHDQIWLSDTTEAQAVDAKLAVSSLGVE